MRHARPALALAAAGLATAVAPTVIAADTPPHRVFMTGAVAIEPAEYVKLPKEPTYRAFTPYGVDLSDEFPRPGYQGQQASCVAWATTYASSSYFHAGRLGRRPDKPGELMSPAYIYNSVRGPGKSCMTPLRLADALAFLRDRGAVSYADFPTDVTQCDPALPAGLADKARAFRLRSFRRIDVGAAPEGAIGPGTLVDLISPEHGVDAAAERAGTIGYEILTSLGARYARRYLD